MIRSWQKSHKISPWLTHGRSHIKSSHDRIMAIKFSLLLCKDLTDHFWAALLSSCHPELLSSQFCITSSEQPKLTVYVDNLSDKLSIAAIAWELHVEDCAVDTPKIEFSANKVLEGRFFNNPSNNIRDHHTVSFYQVCWVKIRWIWQLQFRITQFNILEGVAENAVAPNWLISCG